MKLCALFLGVMLFIGVVEAEYNQTTPINVRKFLKDLNDSTWGGACGSYSRYTRLEAEKVNISLGEVTIIDYDYKRVKRTLCCGHRINYFKFNNSYYYVDNIHDRGVIKRYCGLQSYLNESFSINMSHIGFKDWLSPNFN